MRGRRLFFLIITALSLHVTPLFPARQTITVTAAARALQPGELVVLTMTTKVGAEDLRVRAFDRDVPAFGASPRTWRSRASCTSPGTRS